MACTKGINKYSRCVKKILRYISVPCLLFKVSRFNHRCNLANNIGMGGKLDKLERKKERILECRLPPPPAPPQVTPMS